MSFSITSRFYSLFFICISVKNPNSQIYVNANGINAREAFSITFGEELFIKGQNFVKCLLNKSLALESIVTFKNVS